MPMTDKMLGAKDGAIGWLIFNNPERRNAVSQEMWLAAERILADFQGDEAIRVVVLKGAGDKAFISGADISQFEQKRNSAAAAAEYEQITKGARQKLREFPKPTIAMIHGFCMGGGLATALSCDLRIASQQSEFGIPAAKLGLGYDMGSIGLLMAVVGHAFAREILLTGRRFTAQEAFEMGLVQRLVAREQLESYVREYAQTIAGNAPLTIRAVRMALDELLKDADRRDAAKVKQAVQACFDSEDYREGRTAFMEKRKPAFKGR